jgi:hypothetical protein
MVFQTIALKNFQDDHWYIWDIYFITAFRYLILQSLRMRQ